MIIIFDCTASGGSAIKDNYHICFHQIFLGQSPSKKFSLTQNCNAPLIAPNPDGWEMTLKGCSLPAADGDDEMRKYFHINSAAKEKLGTL